ncbi:hypothetical protein HK405_011734, partial [Cladochytrium tenue]
MAPLFVGSLRYGVFGFRFPVDPLSSAELATSIIAPLRVLVHAAGQLPESGFSLRSDDLTRGGPPVPDDPNPPTLDPSLTALLGPVLPGLRSLVSAGGTAELATPFPLYVGPGPPPAAAFVYACKPLPSEPGARAKKARLATAVRLFSNGTTGGQLVVPNIGARTSSGAVVRSFGAVNLVVPATDGRGATLFHYVPRAVSMEGGTGISGETAVCTICWEADKRENLPAE